ncbi:MATE efflux family protein [Paucilactobacillus hokkaidonensis JCM 18461]|uniref:MATE efflux family protein n=2 Tax=Paucilactobacillus hokkaidonensis TaxID=1193095 RepID=A0A0A1H013_9LACO|nr:MATE family efflux transporter [Paucilactobacillus hokkaidonensis]KRO08874.1 Na+-driven multidrug efflux pump [Paucilactobacillus hokkaidonensis]BAP86593.1 MATE efflux family protein [Paucilactobacillus hokkaidonensis JCM 18461]
MKKKGLIDLTTGRPLTQIIIFAIPLVGGTLFQQLYNFVDTLIVGRMIGIDALAAVGTYYPLSFLILGFIQGSCVGFSIPLARSIGNKNDNDIYSFLINAIWVCILMMIIMTPMMILFSSNLLVLLHTPNNIFSMASIFSIISFSGIPANIAYNYSANVLRSFGDSKHPFYFLIISLVINVILDLILIGPLNMGIAGAAVATVISEAVSAMLNIGWILKKFHIKKFSENSFSLTHISEICLIGIPMGLEYSISAIGAIVMQDAINQLGTASIAAQSAGDKIRQLFTLPMESVGMAMATYTAQNYGAKKINRIKEGIKSGLLIQLVYSIVAFFIVALSKNSLISLVLGRKDGTVFSKANEYLIIISLFFIVHGSLMIFRNVIQGLGRSLYAIFSGFGELIGRSIGGMLALTSLGYTAICYSNQLAWSISLIYCFIITLILFKTDKSLMVVGKKTK